MRINRRHFMLSGAATALALPARSAEGQALVAIAANFTRTAEALLPQFEQETGYRVTLSTGSAGQLYGQIVNGAPYDAFLSADQLRPALLEEAGLGHGRMTYARGLMALWQPEGQVGAESLKGDFRHLAIANPALAPYGLAAQEVLEALGLWAALQARLVLGQNVGQAYALVASGNAELGLIAQSYALGAGAYWAVPESLYAPILQDAILLSNNPAAAAFVDFIRSEPAQAAIRIAGYGAL